MQIYVVTFIATTVVFFVNGYSSELRCHCNLPSCTKTTNSMCKSVLGCFQELPSSTNDRRLRHGCLELWPPARPYQCVADVGGGDEILVRPIYSENDKRTLLLSAERDDDELSSPPNGATVVIVKNLHKRPSTVPLRCCLQDMCNFVDNFQPKNDSRTSLELNVLLVRDSDGDIVSIAKTPNSTTDGAARSVWFTIALIVVPVLGVFVLILLIIFGCYLLRYDAKRDVINNDPTDIVIVVDSNEKIDRYSLLSNNNNVSLLGNKTSDFRRQSYFSSDENNSNFAPLLSVMPTDACQSPPGGAVVQCSNFSPPGRNLSIDFSHLSES